MSENVFASYFRYAIFIDKYTRHIGILDIGKIDNDNNNNVENISRPRQQKHTS